MRTMMREQKKNASHFIIRLSSEHNESTNLYQYKSLRERERNSGKKAFENQNHVLLLLKYIHSTLSTLNSSVILNAHFHFLLYFYKQNLISDGKNLKFSATILNWQFDVNIEKYFEKISNVNSWHNCFTSFRSSIRSVRNLLKLRQPFFVAATTEMETTQHHFSIRDWDRIYSQDEFFIHEKLPLDRTTCVFRNDEHEVGDKRDERKEEQL